MSSYTAEGNRLRLADLVLGEIGLTPCAKKVIQLAIDEAHNLHYNYIGTEHLLLALVREGEGIAAGIFASLEVNLEKVRTQILLVLTPTSVATTAPKQGLVRPCRVCGSPAPYDFNYCFHCGSELKPQGQGSHIFNYCFHCGAKIKSEEQEES